MNANLLEKIKTIDCQQQIIGRCDKTIKVAQLQSKVCNKTTTLSCLQKLGILWTDMFEEAGNEHDVKGGQYLRRTWQIEVD